VAVDAIVERRYWDEAAQTMATETLRRLQTERLRDAVERAYAGSGFFRRRLDDAGVRPEDVASPADLARLPVFRKADLRANEAEFPPIGDYRCVGLHGSVRLATSTGTTGRPTFVLWTANDLRLDYELAARAHWRAGIRPGQVIVNAHPGYLNGGQAMNAGAYEHMGVLPISVGPPVDIEHAEQVLRILEGVPVDHWRLFPAALARFREAATRLGSSVDLPAAEDAGPAAQYDKLSAGQECVSYLGSACAPGRGSHIAEDYAIVEVLDVHTREPVAPGHRGTMVVTSLGRDNPMLRYDLEDIVRVDDAPCQCGETSRRGFWEGRQRDIVWVGDRMVLPIDVWRELPAGAEFALVRRPDADRLEVRVEGSAPADAADRIAAQCGVPVDVVSLAPGTLPRAAYKQERVVDERAHEPSRS
jgi:phenylacetate-CoA ligase